MINNNSSSTSSSSSSYGYNLLGIYYVSVFIEYLLYNKYFINKTALHSHNYYMK